MAELAIFDIPEKLDTNETSVTPRFHALAPAGRSERRLLWNAIEPVISVDSESRANQSLTLWAYNVESSDSVAHIEVTKGNAVASTSSLAPLLDALKAVLGAIPTGIHVSSNNDRCDLFPNDLQFGKQQPAGYTALSTILSLEPGYHYEAKLLPPKAKKDDDDPAPTSTLSFTSRAKHRVVSLAVEAAFDLGGNPPLAGYSFAALASTGPDQLYRLQPNSTSIVDRLMTSVLVVAYPLAPLNRSKWADGLALGFGPTIFHGASTEFAKQWDMRVMYEFPFAPGFLLSSGPSIRSMDEPLRPGVGSVVAVARPGGAPTFSTTSHSEWFFSMGIAVDLSLLTTAASDAASAVTGSGSSSAKGKNK